MSTLSCFSSSPIPLVADRSCCSGTPPLMKIKQSSVWACVNSAANCHKIGLISHPLLASFTSVSIFLFLFQLGEKQQDPSNGLSSNYGKRPFQSVFSQQITGPFSQS